MYPAWRQTLASINHTYPVVFVFPHRELEQVIKYIAVNVVAFDLCTPPSSPPYRAPPREGDNMVYLSMPHVQYSLTLTR